MEVKIDGQATVHEVCSVLPVGARPLAKPSADMALWTSVRQDGADTLMCAEVTTLPRPIQVRFAFTRSR